MKMTWTEHGVKVLARLEKERVVRKLRERAARYRVNAETAADQGNKMYYLGAADGLEIAARQIETDEL